MSVQEDFVTIPAGHQATIEHGSLVLQEGELRLYTPFTALAIKTLEEYICFMNYERVENGSDQQSTLEEILKLERSVVDIGTSLVRGIVYNNQETAQASIESESRGLSAPTETATQSIAMQVDLAQLSCNEGLVSTPRECDNGAHTEVSLPASPVLSLASLEDRNVCVSRDISQMSLHAAWTNIDDSSSPLVETRICSPFTQSNLSLTSPAVDQRVRDCTSQHNNIISHTCIDQAEETCTVQDLARAPHQITPAIHTQSQSGLHNAAFETNERLRRSDILLYDQPLLLPGPPELHLVGLGRLPITYHIVQPPWPVSGHILR